MNRTAASIDAMLRAKDWSLSDLARQRAELLLTREATAAREQGVRAVLDEHAIARRGLVQGGSFRVSELALQRGSAQRILDALAAARFDLERLDRALKQLDDEISEGRSDKAGLEEILAARRAEQAALDVARRQREADELCAARRLDGIERKVRA